MTGAARHRGTGATPTCPWLCHGTTARRAGGVAGVANPGGESTAPRSCGRYGSPRQRPAYGPPCPRRPQRRARTAGWAHRAGFTRARARARASAAGAGAGAGARARARAQRTRWRRRWRCRSARHRRRTGRPLRQGGRNGGAVQLAVAPLRRLLAPATMIWPWTALMLRMETLHGSDLHQN